MPGVTSVTVYQFTYFLRPKVSGLPTEMGGIIIEAPNFEEALRTFIGATEAETLERITNLSAAPTKMLITKSR